MLPIVDVAAGLGIPREHLTLYGDDKAKISLAARANGRAPGKLILVSAITPTDAGEGKTTTSIGLAQGLAKTGRSVCLALREPSLGPTFGMKGGATGGGGARVVPEDDINLHFTGDFHAISTAHNLLAALLDNHIQQGDRLGIDPRRVLWRRVIDMNDRSLRHVVIGLGGALEGVPRETGFDITPASEVMAALCLAEDAEDLRARLARILVALTREKSPVTAADLKAVGSMMVLLKDALKPNLVQTVDGVPALIHGGAGLDTAAVVLVATVRALKLHGGAAKDSLTRPDPAALERGLSNLEKHVESIRIFGKGPVVALNRFATDTTEEIALVKRACERFQVPFAVSDVFACGLVRVRRSPALCRQNAKVALGRPEATRAPGGFRHHRSGGRPRGRSGLPRAAARRHHPDARPSGRPCGRAHRPRERPGRRPYADLSGTISLGMFSRKPNPD
jgi:formate--tetrahydrofolate ligase